MGQCKQKVETYSRVVGFYRPVQDWNLGKQAEYKDRLTFSSTPVKPQKYSVISIEVIRANMQGFCNVCKKMKDNGVA